jgi:hypothetical protein
MEQTSRIEKLTVRTESGCHCEIMDGDWTFGIWWRSAATRFLMCCGSRDLTTILAFGAKSSTI